MIKNQDLLVRIQKDGVNFTLVEYLYCTTDDGRYLRGIIGATSDGLSGGKFIKGILQDVHTFFAATFHDCCWRDQVEESKDAGKTWEKYTPTFEESNQWFKENVIWSGGSEFEAETVKLGVETPEGRAIFAKDRQL